MEARQSEPGWFPSNADGAEGETQYRSESPVPAPSPIALAPAYQRHRPEQTALYSIISEHYPHFVRT
jgi:hypothetical protein